MGRDNRRGRLVLAALLAGALGLATVDLHSDDSSVRGAAKSAVSPIERGLAAAVRPVRNAFSGNSDADKQRKRADALAAQVAALQRQVASNTEAQQVAGQLQQLRLLADNAQFSIIPARLIAAGDATGTEQVVDVDAGRRNGVRQGQLVIAGNGLVGVVARVGATTSTIRLASDPTTTIGARTEGSRALGKITGTGKSNEIEFTLYDPNIPLRTGARIVTYGSQDYAGGVPVGTVTKMLPGGQGLSRRALVKPYVNYGTLDLIGIVVARPTTDPGDRLLPPRPVPAQPTPTPTPSSSTPATLPTTPGTNAAGGRQ